ncbi:phosphatase PAP2 family protein [Amycolatopsis pigmentata]|uniref:Phosphatase PAP2 family protein n=1 Tax=Amycolatopsis pigmentata TaxID=450801 RepID=A0ABW5FJ50_9PSEU
MVIDGRGSRWRRPAIVALAAIVVFLALLATATNLLPWGDGLDRGLHEWVLVHRQSVLVAIAAALTNLGSSWVTIPVVAVVAFAAAQADLRGRVIRSAVVVVVMAGGVLCRSAVAAIIARPRPPHPDWAVPASGFSFPSGHSTDAALAAGLLAWLLVRRVGARGAIWAGAAGYATVVGATRVYLGVHWPSDVLGGWAFAVAWLAFASIALSATGRPGTTSV